MKVITPSWNYLKSMSWYLLSKVFFDLLIWSKVTTRLSWSRSLFISFFYISAMTSCLVIVLILKFKSPKRMTCWWFSIAMPLLRKLLMKACSKIFPSWSIRYWSRLRPLIKWQFISMIAWSSSWKRKQMAPLLPVVPIVPLFILQIWNDFDFTRKSNLRLTNTAR